MGKKKGRQSSNTTVAHDSSGSGELNTSQGEKRLICSHAIRSVDVNLLKKNVRLEELDKPGCALTSKQEHTFGEEYWYCLRCGSKSCCKEHSLNHHQIPHTGPHSLAVTLPSFNIWCHECMTDLPEDYNKKVRGSTTALREMLKKSQLQPSTPVNKSGDKEETKREEDFKKKGDESSPVKKGELKGVRGLVNLGNTCFLNSVLQCLARTPKLSEQLRLISQPQDDFTLQLPSGKRLEGKLDRWDGLTEAVCETLEGLVREGEKGNLAPHKLLTLLRKRCPQFEGYQQHDAHELLRHLLEAVRSAHLKRYRRLVLEEVGLSSKVRPEEVSPELSAEVKRLDEEVSRAVTLAPDTLFRGQLASCLICQECENGSTMVEPFLDLSLPVLLEPTVRRRPPLKEKKRKKHVHHSPIVESDEKIQSDADVEDNEEEERGEETSIEDGLAALSLEDQNVERRVYCAGVELDWGESEEDEGRGEVVDSIRASLTFTKDGAPFIPSLRLNHPALPHLKPVLPSFNRSFGKEGTENLAVIKEDEEVGEEKKGGEGDGVGGEVEGGGEAEKEVEGGGEEEEEVGSGEIDCKEVKEKGVEGRSEVVAGGEKKGEVSEVKEKDNLEESEGKVSELKAEGVKRKSCSPVGGRRGGGGGCGEAAERGAPSNSDHEDCSVEACLAQFTSVELLTGSNKVTCSTCTSRQGKPVCTMSTKQLLIKEAPPVLILHLKRFQVQMYSFRKLTKHVSFPLSLDLAPFTTQQNEGVKGSSMLYSLYGVVEHSGTFNGGHYVAYIKIKDGRWCYVSDGVVHEAVEARVLASQAYLLFYEHSPS